MNNQERLKAFMNNRLANGLAESSLRMYKLGIDYFLDFLSDREPTPELVDEFKIKMNSNGLKPASVNAYLKYVRAFLIFCHERGYIEQRIKVLQVRYQREKKRVISDNELDALLAVCEGKKRTLRRDRLLLLLIVNTGMRRGEVASLRWSDVDLETGIITISATKSKEVREAYLKPELLAELINWRHDRFNPLPNDSDDLIFNLTGDGVRTVLRRIGERTNIKFVPHDLRRTFATLCVRAGITPFMLQRLMGHKHIEQTMEYVVLVPDDVQAEFEKFEGVS